MPLTTAAEVRQAGMFPAGAAEYVDDALTNIYIPVAAKRLKKWVGAAAYADAELETPVNAERAADLKNAEKFLALNEIFRAPIMNHFESGGIVETQGGPNGGNTKFFGPEKLNQMADSYLAAAERLTDDYNILDTDTTPKKSFAYDDDGEPIE